MEVTLRSFKSIDIQGFEVIEWGAVFLSKLPLLYKGH